MATLCNGSTVDKPVYGFLC